jgi:hypothetical protein
VIAVVVAVVQVLVLVLVLLLLGDNVHTAASWSRMGYR